MDINLYRDVVGNINTKSFLQNLLRKGGTRFIILHGPSGHGKSTLARISSAYTLCKNVNDKDKEPCLICDSCSNIYNNRNTEYYLNINVARFNDMNFVDDFKQEISRLTESKIVIVLEEIHMLDKKPQAAMLDVLDKMKGEIIVVGTTSKLSRIIPELRKRALCLKTGLSRFESNILIQRILESYPVSNDVREYLLDKNLSPREIEIIITEHFNAGKLSLSDFKKFFNDLPMNEIITFIDYFCKPLSQFATYLYDKDNEYLSNITKSAFREVARIIQKIELNSGAKERDYSDTLLTMLKGFSSFELYRLLKYLQEASKSNNIIDDIYIIKFDYERSKRNTVYLEQLSEYKSINRGLYKVENNKETNTDIPKQEASSSSKFNSIVALESFGNKRVIRGDVVIDES